VVAIGGGGIKTMQRYWERATTKAEQRGPELTQQARQSAQPSAFDDGDGPAYAPAASDESEDERTERLLRRDR